MSTERPKGPGRLMMTAFGWNDSGGGTTVPRLTAKELARRGWEVTVFHAAVHLTGSGIPYELVEWEEDGVRLIGVHNRPHGLFDLGNPRRELDDPPITAAFAAALDRLAPEVVHFHNLHNLGSSLIDQAAVRGLAGYFTTHNYWLICPRAYLLTGQMSICPGPGDGTRCATCVGALDAAGHHRRLAEIRARAETGLNRILAVSDAVRETLLAVGYDPLLVDVLRQAMPHEGKIWEAVGRTRSPGRLRERLTVAFVGSAYPHKGPQLLVEAAQRTTAVLDIRIIGEIAPSFGSQLRELDKRGVVQLHGGFDPTQIGELLGDVDAVVLPSMWWDCAPLAAAESIAAGTPLIVPRLGGLPEAIRDGTDGLAFNGLDVDDLAHQLDRLAQEQGLLERLQAAIGPPHAFSEYVDELEAYYAGERPPQASSASGNETGARAPAVRWQGDHALPTSLSIINDRVTERLGLPLQRLQTDGSSTDPPLPHPATVEVHQQWPPDFSMPGAGRLATIVPWEFGSIPEQWLGQIERTVDELWVPSEFVRDMYVADGVDPDRVRVIPNGVDLTRFSPGPGREADTTGGRTRFLFVGGLIWRKGPDILFEAFRSAFPEHDDVELVVKDFGADGIYRGGIRAPFHEHISAGRLPQITLIGEALTTEELVSLYRSCDVLVHPYRGEGFAMPVLEAMACGLPAITTGGGPTDEFCPPDAGWRIRSTRQAIPRERLGELQPAASPWALEPDLAHLIELMKAAAHDRDDRLRRGIAARRAAESLPWDAVADQYRQRIAALAERTPKLASRSREPFPLTQQPRLRVLATPAWAGHDQLPALLRDWSRHTAAGASACLYLLADPAVTGSAEEVQSHVLNAGHRAGVELEACADIEILFEPFRADRDDRLHAAMSAFVPVHLACEGHARRARAAGNPVLSTGSDALAQLLAGSAQGVDRNDR